MVTSPAMMILGSALHRSPSRSRNVLQRFKWRFLSGDSRTGTKNGESLSSAPGATSQSVEWRKHQLDKLEQQFSPDEPVLDVVSEDEVQPMWREMESRVTNRKSLTAAQRGGRVGRRNVRTTDEEIWLKEGLYDVSKEETKNT